MRDKVKIRRAVIEDLPFLQSLHGQRFADIFVHEYLSYRPEETVFCVAEMGSRIVGTQVFLPYELHVNGKRILTGRSERTMVVPVSEGILSDLMDASVLMGTEVGMKFFWGASTSPEAIKSFKRVGFIHLRGHREYWSAIASKKAFGKYVTKTARTSLSSERRNEKNVRRGRSDALLRYFQIASGVPSILAKLCGQAAHFSLRRNIVLCEQKLSEERVDAFLETLRARGSQLFVSHDKKFIEWTIEKGGNDGRWLFAYEDSRLVGYVCVSINGEYAASVIDFAAIDSAVIQRLLGRVIEIAEELEKAFVSLVCNPNNELQRNLFQGLLSAGFVRSFRAGGTSIVRPGDFKDMNVLGSPELWYMTDLWSMLYKSSSLR